MVQRTLFPHTRTSRRCVWYSIRAYVYFYTSIYIILYEYIYTSIRVYIILWWAGKAAGGLKLHWYSLRCDDDVIQVKAALSESRSRDSGEFMCLRLQKEEGAVAGLVVRESKYFLPAVFILPVSRRMF